MMKELDNGLSIVHYDYTMSESQIREFNRIKLQIRLIVHSNILSRSLYAADCKLQHTNIDLES